MREEKDRSAPWQIGKDAGYETAHEQGQKNYSTYSSQGNGWRIYWNNNKLLTPAKPLRFCIPRKTLRLFAWVVECG